MSARKGVGVGAALTTMNDDGGAGGDDGGAGDGGMEGGMVDPNMSVDGMLTSLGTEMPDEHCYFVFLRFI